MRSGGGGMTIELIKDGQLWDEFVDESPYGTLFHKWNFLKIVERHAGYRLFPYGAYKGEKLLGIFPLFYKNAHGVKMLFSPPPRTGIYYLGFVLSKDYDNLKQSKKESDLGHFSDEMEKTIADLSPDYIHISTVPNFLDTRFFKWNNYSVEPNYTYVTDLSKSAEEIMGGFHRYLRRDIKSAENSGMRIGLGEDVSAFCAMQSKRYEEQGMIDPLISEEYFSDLVKAYPDNIRVYYLYEQNGGIISALATQEYKDRFQGWMGLTKTVEHANELIIWNLMQIAKAKNYKKFEIIGANVKNQCPFKSKFNPSLERNYIINKKNLKGNIAEWVYVNLIKNKKFSKL
jgi:lipid II:glycine glycyltransferase (peptidoglycan interpeptide bridge formation enzyme)